VLEAVWNFLASDILSPLKPYLDPGKLPEN